MAWQFSKTLYFFSYSLVLFLRSLKWVGWRVMTSVNRFSFLSCTHLEWVCMIFNFHPFFVNIVLPHVDRFVMVWLMMLRDIFSSNYYYWMWIGIDFFCAYSYVVDHLVASSVWERCWALVSSLSVGTWLSGVLKIFLLSSIIQITTEVFLPA